MNAISLCIATYRRPERLALVLRDILAQSRLPDEIIVVDNDRQASANPVVAALSASGTAKFAVRYAVQPQKNISLTRNMTVALATGDWLAFIDDDERAPPGWLATLMAAAERFDADGVLGPVLPLVPPTAPEWIRRGRFYEYPRMPTGTVIPPNRLRFGNVLVKARCLSALEGPFDPALGLTGGEDGDLLSRVAQAGAKLVWCDEATVTEPVVDSRLSMRWLLLRALSGGQDFARHALAGRYGRMSPLARARFFLRAMLQSVLACVLAAISWPFGTHHAVRWLATLWANLGKLSVFFGWRYREYA